MAMSKLRQAVFYGVAALPAVVLLAAMGYLMFMTNAPQQAYLKYVRNINFDCFAIVDQPYVYRMMPGECHFNNLEYQTVQHIDAQGFRNPGPQAYKADTVILGDSHAYGFAVNDADTLGAQLKQRHGIDSLNLAIPTYATWRELAAANLHAPNAKTVVIQYCENDLEENGEYASFPPEEEAMVRNGVLQSIRDAQAVYHANKAQASALDIVKAVAHVIVTHDFTSKRQLRDTARVRDVAHEGEVFAGMLYRYRDYLAHRRVILLESVSFGRNSPAFKAAFEQAVHARLPDLDVRAIDSSQQLKSSDYFFLDDHPRPSAYRKLADVLAPLIAAARPANDQL